MLKVKTIPELQIAVPKLGLNLQPYTQPPRKSNSALSKHKNHKICCICSIRLTFFLVKYEKYGTLSMKNNNNIILMMQIRYKMLLFEILIVKLYPPITSLSSYSK